MNIGSGYNMTQKVHLILIFASVFSVHCLAAEQISDPTMPPSYRENQVVDTPDQSLIAKQYEWTLNSTIISPYLKIAIINGKQLEVGEEINNATVKHIGHQQVNLSYQDKIITLSLHQSFISQIKTAP